MATIKAKLSFVLNVTRMAILQPIVLTIKVQTPKIKRMARGGLGPSLLTAPPPCQNIVNNGLVSQM